MGKKTPLYDLHVKAEAKIVDFAGWDMPLHYGSQIKEHHQVRQQVGMFDVSHMGVIDLHGNDASSFLQIVLANNIERISEGRALYSCMLNEQGGVLDDLIVYKMSDQFYRIVVNAGTREKDLAWMQKQAADFAVSFTERQDLAMFAVQGPLAKNKIQSILPVSLAEKVTHLKPFTFIAIEEWFIARTGYTGEDGYELILPKELAVTCWQTLLQHGVMPCGLGARDTLRLEAGLNLYGLDMDESVTPLEANLAWTVVFEPKDRHFIGRAALETQMQAGVKRHLVGLVLKGPGIIRHHQKVFVKDRCEGEVTSGGYSPTLEKSIALARLPQAVSTECFVEIRNKPVPAEIIKPPFVRQGKKMF